MGRGEEDAQLLHRAELEHLHRGVALAERVRDLGAGQPGEPELDDLALVVAELSNGGP